MVCGWVDTETVVSQGDHLYNVLVEAFSGHRCQSARFCHNRLQHPSLWPPPTESFFSKRTDSIQSNSATGLLFTEQKGSAEGYMSYDSCHRM